MEEITPLLEKLAEQLATTIPYLWQVLINQAQVYVINYTVNTVLVFMLAIAFGKSIGKFNEWLDIDDDSWQCVSWFVASVLLGIIVCLGVAAQVLNFNYFITALLNPEYWALQEILMQLNK